MLKNSLKFSKIWVPWKLEIHCWGGLGSQLFAWAFAEELLNSGFRRKITLVLHSSGVTQRHSEINHLSGRIHIENIYDFSDSAQSIDSVDTKSGISRLRRGLIFILSTLQLVIFSDTFERIRPWTFQIRSHYSHRPLSNHTLTLMISTLREFSSVSINNTDSSARTAIHYRLGDLLTLDNKTFVPAERVVLALEKINGRGVQGDTTVDVFSDSPAVAFDKLSKQNRSFQFNSVDCSSWDLMVKLLKYPNFIATNSKIGILVTLLRQIESSNLMTFVPKELESTFNFLLLDKYSSDKIIFY